MIQCALNGDFGPGDHPEAPVTLGELVGDARACWEAGAASVHLHPRRASDGVESDPSVRSHPADPADEARRSTANDPRLQAQRHHEPLRALEIATGEVTGTCYPAIPTKSSSRSSTGS
jgi:hypothetical protein